MVYWDSILRLKSRINYNPGLTLDAKIQLSLLAWDY